MSIPTGGLAALLVLAALALSSCGGDNGSVATTTTIVPGSSAATTQTQTQTVASKTSPATTTQKTQTTAPKPAQTTTQKTQTTAPKPAATTKASVGCASVDVGARDGDVDETYARITGISKVNCQTATYVIQQYGGQKIGAGKALLPIGWRCSASTCSKAGSSVSFTLEFPSD